MVRVPVLSNTTASTVASCSRNDAPFTRIPCRPATAIAATEVIFTATDYLEFYASIGRGFHSADLRGVNQDTSVDLGLPHTPLLARQEGQEVGVRTEVASNLAFALAVYNL
jgi:hypothetical protein